MTSLSHCLTMTSLSRLCTWQWYACVLLRCNAPPGPGCKQKSFSLINLGSVSLYLNGHLTSNSPLPQQSRGKTIWTCTQMWVLWVRNKSTPLQFKVGVWMSHCVCVVSYGSFHLLMTLSKSWYIWRWSTVLHHGLHKAGRVWSLGAFCHSVKFWSCNMTYPITVPKTGVQLLSCAPFKELGFFCRYGEVGECLFTTSSAPL